MRSSEQRRPRQLEARPQRRESPASGGAAYASVGPGDETSLAGPSALKLRRLADVLASYAAHDGGFPLRLPGTYAIRRVGYVSASQFSREYARFFGSAPIKDVAQLRERGFAPTEVAR